MTTLVRDAPVSDRFAAARSAWRTLLVHVQPEAEAQPRLDVAADLARMFDATLVGVGAEFLQPIAASDPYGLLGGEFVSAMLDVIQSNLAHAGDAFLKATAGHASDWVTVQDLPDRAMTRLARCADLIIAGGMPTSSHDNYRTCETGELILQCGRPVLLAPPAGGKLKAEAVVVAWKDSREARRTLSDSLPLLKGAGEVLLVEVCRKEDANDIAPHHAALIRYLASHGVTARSKIIPGDAAEAHGHLQAQARAIGADLIVSGGYGHSRLGEWVFGGLTADLIADPERFVLFSH